MFDEYVERARQFKLNTLTMDMLTETAQSHGISTCGLLSRSIRDDFDPREEWSRDPDYLNQIVLCMDFIQHRTRPSNRGACAWLMRHEVEEYYGYLLCNGAFILAMKILEIPFTPKRGMNANTRLRLIEVPKKPASVLRKRDGKPNKKSARSLYLHSRYQTHFPARLKNCMWWHPDLPGMLPVQCDNIG